MSVITEVRAQSADFYKEHTRSIRRIVLVQMGISTALSAVSLLLGLSSALHIALILLVGYLSNVATMLMIAQLATLPKALSIKEALTQIPALWVAALCAPVFTALLMLGLNAILQANFMLALVFIVSFIEPDIWGILQMLAIVLALALIAMVYMAIYVSITQLLIRRVETGERVTGGAVRSAIREGIRQVLTPAILYGQHIGYFAIIGALVVALLIVPAILLAPWMLGRGAIGIVGGIMTQWIEHAPLFGMLLVAGYTWILGLGAWFWPRYRMTHVLYQKRLMQGATVVEEKTEAQSENNTEE